MALAPDTYYAEHLVAALNLAIRRQRAREAEMGYTSDSGLVAVWAQMREALDAGRTITVISV